MGKDLKKIHVLHESAHQQTVDFSAPPTLKNL